MFHSFTDVIQSRIAIKMSKHYKNNHSIAMITFENQPNAITLQM